MALMAMKSKLDGPRIKNKIRRKGRHAKIVKARDKKQNFFTQGACRG
jgi:hypothetical protein